MVCLFSPLYQTHPADHLTSLTSALSNHLSSQQGQEHNDCSHASPEKCLKSNWTIWSPVCGDTGRAAYYDRCNSYVLSRAEQPQGKRKVYFCPNHCVMPMGAPWIAAPLEQPLHFLAMDKMKSPFGLFHSLSQSISHSEKNMPVHISQTAYTNCFNSLFKCCLLQEECANWKVWGEIRGP